MFCADAETSRAERDRGRVAWFPPSLVHPDETAEGAVLAKNNKVYFPIDAVAKHEDFDMWYDDGDLFLHFEGDWSEEKNKIAVIGRMGGEIGCIKPDFKSLSYYLREGRWEYSLVTHTIFKHYYVEGMVWDIHGSMRTPPFTIYTQNRAGDKVKDVHIKVVDFRNKGLCYEVRVKDLSKLRIAAIAAVAICIKEENKGESRGEDLTKDAPRMERIKRRIFSSSSKTYDEMVAEDPEIAKIAAMEPRPSR